VSDVRKWLEGIGLAQYADAFEANDIDMDLLEEVDEQVLKDIGISSAGHRLRIRSAIAKLARTSRGDVGPDGEIGKSKQQATSAERRQLTVMFVDLVGSTALCTRLDPEDMREVTGAYHRCCTDQINKVGGFVAKYMGDGVLAYFGYPQAHEDDPERAVRGALSLIDAVPKLRTGHDIELLVRVGLATGVVVVGDLIGEGDARERGVVGDTPNLAARLQALAEPGQLVISQSTQRLTGGLFDYRDLGAIALKGFAEPVQAWHVLGASTAEGRFYAQHQSGLTPLVGREEELEKLQRTWEQAREGEGRVVLLSGEPGIGKSRLTDALQGLVAGEQHHRLRFFCSPDHANSALHPVIRQLERVAGFERSDLPMQKSAKLEAMLSDLAQEEISLIADLLSLPTEGRFRVLEMNPQKRKEKTLAALLTQLESWAHQHAVLLIYEDVHWIDPTTQQLLDMVVERVARLPVLLLITFRPEFTPPWNRQAHVASLTLVRLGQSESVSLVERVVGENRLSAEIVAEIVERADGVPLFAEELTKAVLESIDRTDDAKRIVSTGLPSKFSVPSTLHASLMARLDRLGPDAKEVAQIGAAIGREFSYELLALVAQKSDLQLQSALDRFGEAGLVFCRGVPPDATFLFKHALVRDASYGTLLRGNRQQLHSRIAAVLEGEFPELVNTQPEMLAHHCAEAGFGEKAVGYWLKAGQRAVSRSAMTEAVFQLRKGLDLVATLPDSAARQQQELDLQIALGRALMAAKGMAAPAVGETYARARALAEQLGRGDYVFPLLFGQWIFYNVRAEHRLALSVAKQMQQTGEAKSDSSVQVLGSFLGGIIRFYLGEFAAARELFERCSVVGDPIHRRVHMTVAPEDSNGVRLVHLAEALAHLGYADQARARLNEALAEARQLGHAYGLAHVLAQACNEAFLVGAHHDAERHSQEVVALSTEHGFPVWLGFGLLHRGWVLTALGSAEEGLTVLTEGLSVVRGTGAVCGSAWALTILASCYSKLGRLVDAHRSVAEATRIIETTEERYIEAELHRVHGELLVAKGDRGAAEQSYHQAVAVARRQNAKLGELRASTSLARLLRDQGKPAAARNLLSPIYGWFTEGFDTPVLKEAKALLEELSA
jgi:class 3 adenylate cyclase/predicted ATPase